MTFNSILLKIDRVLDKKEKREINYIYIMIFGGMLYLSYTYLFGFSEKVYEQNRHQISKLKNSINRDKIYLQNHNQNELRKLSKEIIENKKQVSNLMVEKEYIEYELNNISYLYYDEKVWGEFIDSIAQKAKKNIVTLVSLGNKFVKERSDFGHVLELEINVEGTFSNIIRFLNSIEQSNLVIDVFELEMKNGKTISSNFKISVWGINH